jgi:hypothetical protein
MAEQLPDRATTLASSGARLIGSLIFLYFAGR